MARKADLALFHKENISSVADRLFLENGVEKTTMDEIAREAEYSKATIYAYFKSKEEIFHYIVKKGMQLLHQELERALRSNDDTIAAYYAYCNALASYAERHPLYFESILQTIATDTGSRRESPVLEGIYQIGEGLNRDVELLMRRGVEQGVFRSDLPCLATGLVQWSALSGIISLGGKKQDYISQRIGMSKGEFMQFGFDMMLQAIKKHGQGGDCQ